MIFIWKYDIIFSKRGENNKMGILYENFKLKSKQAPKNWFTDKIVLVKFTLENRNYEIYFTRKRANKYSIIHCKNNTIEWEQFPILPRIAGRMYGTREPIISLSPSKNCIKIFVVKGTPNSIIGLDEGIFASARKYDEKRINVMSEARFKEI